ncbi:MAG: DUF4351 domain-containing protein [Chloroflexaceae bacterium]|nr:DUF4351 domain-containing protein [Chloroflexaceae bacterium]
MTDHDQLFKRLFGTFFIEFLELFFPPVARYIDRNWIEFLDKETFTDIAMGDSFDADLVVKTRFHDQLSYFLIHTEHQSEPEPFFPRRHFRYFALLFLKYNLPIYPIVVFSDRSQRRQEPTEYTISFPDLNVLRFNYRVVQVGRLHWRDFVDVLNPVACALLCLMARKREERPLVLLASLRLLVRLKLDRARPLFIGGFINTYLRLDEQEKETYATELAQLVPAEQEAVMELTTSWKEEGIQEKALDMTRQLLLRRLGTLSPDVEAELVQRSAEQLDQLFDAVFSLNTAADLEAWLVANPPATRSNGHTKGIA